MPSFHPTTLCKGNNDECYTPDYGVTPILKYIPPYVTVWCPFDKQESEFVKQITARGKNKVIASHIDNGQDFFTYEPKEEWDCIVSNPPFTNKRQVFERALSFNKPFALIMTLTWLNDSAPKTLFAETELQLLLFDKRIRYFSPDKGLYSNPPFSSAYYCRDFLPKQIIMERLNR